MATAVALKLARLVGAALVWSAVAGIARANEITFERSELAIVTARGEYRFRIELALTDAQRERGLQHRPFLAEDAGMLFVYDRPGAINMWMLNTLIPLDMIFIGPDGRILSIAERTRPKSLEVIPSKGPAVAVLEVLGGTSARLGLRMGDRVVHPLLAQFGSPR
jgi:uncharacterized membrane protein (UPF0127 family)